MVHGFGLVCLFSDSSHLVLTQKQRNNRTTWEATHITARSCNDISGLIKYADVLAVLIFPDPRAVLRHVRNIKLVHVGIAPSLIEIDSGNTQVGLLVLTFFLNYGFSDTVLTR